MKLAHRYNMETGEFIENVMLYPDDQGEYLIPRDCTDIPLPQPNWKPIFQNGDWVETVVDEDKPVAPDPDSKSEIDTVREEIEEVKLSLEDMGIKSKETDSMTQIGLAELGQSVEDANYEYQLALGEYAQITEIDKLETQLAIAEATASMEKALLDVQLALAEVVSLIGGNE